MIFINIMIITGAAGRKRRPSLASLRDAEAASLGGRSAQGASLSVPSRAKRRVPARSALSAVLFGQFRAAALSKLVRFPEAGPCASLSPVWRCAVARGLPSSVTPPPTLSLRPKVTDLKKVLDYKESGRAAPKRF